MMKVASFSITGNPFFGICDIQNSPDILFPGLVIVVGEKE
jgi:hypothetical protein